MKNFFQRHSGARKPTSDSTPTYQVWLPPAIESQDGRTRHRTIEEPLNYTADVSRAGEKCGSSRTHHDSVSRIAPSGNNYMTDLSIARGSHLPTDIQAASIAFASAAAPSNPDPGQYLGGSTGWSTSQHPSVPMRSLSIEHTPTVRRQYDAQRQRRSDGRYLDGNKGGERERRTREREVDAMRYKARLMEKSGQRKDSVQDRDRDEDRRIVLDDERERKDRRRNREKIKRDKEKESDSDRNRDRERGRNERTGVHRQDKEYQEAHRVRERGKDKKVDGGQPTERNIGREMTKDLWREREKNEPRKRAKGNVDRRGKVGGKDHDSGIPEREYGLDGKGPANADRYGFSGMSQVHKDLREEHPYVTYQPEDEFKQGRQHDQVRELDQPKRRRDNYKDQSYLDRRFEPGNAEWDSASILGPQPRRRHRYTPAYDETNLDSSPRKDLPRLSESKRNLTEVQSHHLSIMGRPDSVPLAPPDPALAYPRQATSRSNSRENQARCANLNFSSLPSAHREKDLNLVSPDQLSRVEPTAIVTSPREIGHSKHKERQMIENNPNNVLMEFPPASSAREMLTHHSVELQDQNTGRSTKYDEASDSLSSQWPFPKKRSSSRPSPLIDNNNTSMGRAEKQRLEEQLDHTIAIPESMYTNATKQATLHEDEMVGNYKHFTRTVEQHTKLLSTDAPPGGSSENQDVTRQGRHLSNPNTHQIPSGFPAVTQVSEVREPQMESHRHQPEMNVLRPTELQTSGVLKVMQPYPQTRDQPSQILSTRMTSLDTPSTDIISRKLPELIGSKDRLLAGQPIHGTPNVSKYAVPVDDYVSIPTRTTSNRIQVESTPEEIPRKKSSQFHDTFPSLLNPMQSTPSVSVDVGITRSVAQSSVALPLIRQSSARGQTAVLEDVSLQIHPRLGSAIETSVSQGAYHPPVMSNIVTEHKGTQHFPTHLPNTRSIDVTINSKLCSSLDIPTHLPHPRIQTKTMESPLSHQPGSFSSMEIACNLPHPPTMQLYNAEHLPQNVCKARTDGTLSDNAPYHQIQTSRYLQEASAGLDIKTRALQTSIEPSSAVGLQPTDINVANEASTPNWTGRTLDQALRYPVLTESGAQTSSRSHSIVQQRKTTDMKAETVRSEDIPIALGASNDVDNKISSYSASLPSSSDAAIKQVSSLSNQVVLCKENAGGSLEASTNVKMQITSSYLSSPVIAAKDRNLLQSERPGEFDNVITSSSTHDAIHIASRDVNTKADDIDGVVTSSVKSATVNSISLPFDQTTSDGPSRYRSSTESLAQAYSDKNGQRIPSELKLKPSVSKLRAGYKASLIPNQATPHILRPATAIGYRQIIGEGSIPLLTKVVRDVPIVDKKLISPIQRPATAMSSRHLPSERPRIHSVSQAPSVQSRPLNLLQSRPTDPSDFFAPTDNRAILSTRLTNRLDATLPISPEGALSKHMRTELQSASGHHPEDKLKKMQLPDQESFSNTLTPELEVPAAKNEVPSLGDTHGAPVAQAPPDAPLVQHHVASSTPRPFRDDRIVAPSSQFQLKESASQGDQPPIHNARLAELLSNPTPVYQQTPPIVLNDLQSSRAVISRSGQSSVVRPGIEQPSTQITQPETTSLNQKRVPEKYSQEVGPRTFTAQKSTRVPEQSKFLQNHTIPSMGMLASNSQQSAPGYTLPPIVESTAQSRINQDHLVGSKSQKHNTSRIVNHGFSPSTSHIQQTQTHPHTHDDQNKGPRKGTVELTQSLPVDNTYAAGTTQITSRHQTPQRAARSKDQSKTLQKHNPVIQSHTVSVDTAVPPNSSTTGGPSLKVSASHVSSHQQSQGIPSTLDNDCQKPSHKLAAASSSKRLVPPSNLRPNVLSTQRTEPPSHRSRSNTPINNPSSSQVDLILNRHVLPSSSQVSQPSLQSNVFVPPHSGSSSVKPRSTSRNHGMTAMPSTAAGFSSKPKSPPGHQRATAPEVVNNTFQSNALQKSILTTTSLPLDSALARHKHEMSRRLSEDSVLLRTPSSLTPTILKPSTSRTSIPTSFSSQTSSKKRGLFNMFRTKVSQSPEEESQKPAPRKLRKEPKPKAEKISDAALPPDTKVTPAASLRAKAPPITVQQAAECKSPNKVFTPFRYLTTKRNRRVSQASLEAQDGTAPNTVIGSPTASIHSSQPPPIRAPPLRDVLAATQEWRRMEAAEIREVTGGKMRRARPGVVFDVAEDHTEEDRPKIRPHSRQN